MWSIAKKNSIALPLECKKLILLNALFQGGRLFTGAICVLYFLSFNLTTQEYAWVKTTQAIIFIGLDIPLGYFLNRLGEFKSLIVSLLFGAIGALGYLFFANLIGFLVSEAFLALSLSTWPVALSGYSMRVLENYKIDGLTEKFFHFGDSISNLFILTCGFLGGLLYASNKYFPYGFFLSTYLIAVLLAVFLLKDFGRSTQTRKRMDFFANIREIGQLLPIASILFITQFLMQPLLHYWQPFFSEIFKTDPKEMSVIFIAYSLSMSTISLGYSKLTQHAILRTSIFVLSIAIVGSLFYFLTTQFHMFSVLLIFFSLTFGVFNLIQVATGVLIQNRLKQENRMVITKYISFYSRLGMILSLIYLHWLFANNWSSLQVYRLYGTIAVSAFSLYLVLMVWQNKKEKKYV